MLLGSSIVAQTKQFIGKHVLPIFWTHYTIVIPIFLFKSFWDSHSTLSLTYARVNLKILNLKMQTISRSLFKQCKVCCDFLRGDLHQEHQLIIIPQEILKWNIFSLTNITPSILNQVVNYHNLVFFVILFADDAVLFGSLCFYFSSSVHSSLVINSISHHALSKDGIHPFKGLKPAARQANSPRTEPSKTCIRLRPGHDPSLFFLQTPPKCYKKERSLTMTEINSHI